MKKLLTLFSICFLFFIFSSDAQADIIQNNSSYLLQWGYNSTNNVQYIAQSFTPTEETVTGFKLKFGRYECLEDESNYKPRVLISETLQYFGPSEADWVMSTDLCGTYTNTYNSPADLIVNFSNPISVASSSTWYLIFLSGDFTHGNNWSTRLDNTGSNPYAGGSFYLYQNSAWQIATNEDLYFEIYEDEVPPGEPELTVLTPEHLSLASSSLPILFSGEYNLNGFSNFTYGLAEIHNVDLNLYTYFDFSVASTTYSGVQTFEKERYLTDGNYDFTFRLYDVTTSEETTPAISHYFIVGTSTPYIIVASSTPPETPNFADEDFGLLGNLFRDVIAWLFYPSNTAVESFKEIREELMTKSPFGYFTLAREKMLEIESSGGSAPTLMATINLGSGNQNVKLFDMAETANIVGSSGMTLLYNIIKYAVWLGFLAFCYHEIKRIFSSQNV